MKHFLFVLICLAIGLVGCGEGSSGNDTPTEGIATADTDASPIAFEVKNAGPVSDAETTVPVHKWVPGILKIDPDKVAINLCIENNKYIYFITMDKKAGVNNTAVEIYNAKQEKVCEIGGPQMVNTCPEFQFDGSKDCNPVFLK